jgi:hypothetical protein
MFRSTKRSELKLQGFSIRGSNLIIVVLALGSVFLTSLTANSLFFRPTTTERNLIVPASPGPPAGERQQDRAKQKSPPLQIQTLKISIQPTGFEPNNIVCPSKPFLLALDNESGLDDLQLRLLHVTGKSRETRREVRLSLTEFRNRAILDLPPGQYVLEENSHPQWECSISVLSN